MNREYLLHRELPASTMMCRHAATLALCLALSLAVSIHAQTTPCVGEWRPPATEVVVVAVTLGGFVARTRPSTTAPAPLPEPQSAPLPGLPCTPFASLYAPSPQPVARPAHAPLLCTAAGSPRLVLTAVAGAATCKSDPVIQCMSDLTLSVGAGRGGHGWGQGGGAGWWGRVVGRGDRHSACRRCVRAWCWRRSSGRCPLPSPSHLLPCTRPHISCECGRLQGTHPWTAFT